MREVLISVQPKWCEKIVHIIGQKDNKPIYEKSVEVRKTRPKIDTPFKCYIYQTKKPVSVSFSGTGKHISEYDKTCLYNKRSGKVIGEFVCDRIYDVIQFGMGIAFGDNGLIIEPQEMLNKACLTETELEKYFESSGGYAWHISDLVIYDKPKELSEFNHCGRNYHFNPPITRPPQSWCYVELLKGGADNV